MANEIGSDQVTVFELMSGLLNGGRKLFGLGNLPNNIDW